VIYCKCENGKYNRLFERVSSDLDQSRAFIRIVGKQSEVDVLGLDDTNITQCSVPAIVACCLESILRKRVYFVIKYLEYSHVGCDMVRDKAQQPRFLRPLFSEGNI
jgi:hypothetical protein